MILISKALCLNILIIICSIRSIQCDCIILLPEDLSLWPIFYKYVGSNKLKLNTNKDRILNLHEGQKLEAHCNINFEEPKYYENSNELNIRCQAGYTYTYTSADGDENDFWNPTLQCSTFKWRLYESVINFKWCPFNVTSYLLARTIHPVIPMHSINTEILAGICYDIYNLSFYSIYYTLDGKKTGYAQPSVLQHHGLSMEIKYIEETVGPNKIPNYGYDEKDQFDNCITLANYDYGLIIPHFKLYHTFNDNFLPLLEFVWWRNLRRYNWNHYVNALEKHVENDNLIYDILAGVSGVTKAPIIKSCSKNYTLEEVVFNTNQHIPLYVWNYLQESTNSSNEVVVIGFNSPFHEFYSHDDIIFCPDKCHEIPWLKEVSSSFHYRIMGIIFCCDVEDVRFSKRLQGFPESDIKSKPVELSTELSYETTEDYE